MKERTIGRADVYREPFRLFFPLGWAAGVFAVGMWLLYFAEVWSYYPGVVHARLMILGFLGAFVIGFLGTAAPRMLEVPPLSASGVGTLAVLWLFGVGAYASGRPGAGDALFLAQFAAFAAMGAARFRHRKDLPPPAFVLVLWGFVHLFLGLIFLLAAPRFGWDAAWSRLGANFLYQGFLLCPMLGIGTFLFPKLLGYPPPKVTFPGSPRPTPEWRRSARRAFLAGLAIFSGFWIEIWVHEAAGALLRLTAVAVFIAATVPLWRRPESTGFFPWALRLGLPGLVFGLVVAAVTPWRLGGLHIAFIAGFGLVTLLVATRVILGHSGQIARFRTRMPFIGFVLAATLAAIAVRVLADFRPEQYIPLLVTSAVLWLLATVYWGLRVLPSVCVPDDEPE